MNLTRRGFLKAGALTAAGLAGAGVPAQATRPEMQAAPGGPMRPTSYGPVQGKQTEGTGCLVWYGVPYGAAAAGALRWQPPQDPAPWSDPLDCTCPAPMALQPCNGAAAGAEDCLRLDICAPADAAGLPVVVYFHGGGNRTGSAEEISGSRLAQKADCVFVSVSYRLGLLGFNCLPALQNGPDGTGNYALLDAAQAFDWVQENIASFGGDPGNVTAMGFSAGGRDVMAMLISPYFTGRFQKAVSLSGGLTTADPAASARQIAHALAPLAVEQGLFADEAAAAAWLLTDGEEVRRWLYDQDPAQLCLRMPDGGGIRMACSPHLFADGVLLPETGFDAPACNAVPLMLVTGATEFSLFNPFVPQYEAEGLSTADAVSARRFASEYGSELYRLFNGAGAAAVLAPSFGAPIWLCEVEYGSSNSESPITALDLGSFHGISLSLLSGENTLAGLVSLNSPGYAALGDLFTGAVKAFLHSGDPAAPGLAWQPWTPREPRALALDAGLLTASASMREAPAHWDAVLDRLDADNSVPAQVKQMVVRRILNGRIFSDRLDERYHNPSLWTL